MLMDPLCNRLCYDRWVDRAKLIEVVMLRKFAGEETSAFFKITPALQPKLPTLYNLNFPRGRPDVYQVSIEDVFNGNYLQSARDFAIPGAHMHCPRLRALAKV